MPTYAQPPPPREPESKKIGFIALNLKWGILNVPFCSIFVPFHFYLIMTLVVPCFDNKLMVLLIFALGNFKIGATKPIFLDFGSPRGGGGVRACVRGYGLLSLYSSYTKFK